MLFAIIISPLVLISYTPLGKAFIERAPILSNTVAKLGLAAFSAALLTAIAKLRIGRELLAAAFGKAVMENQGVMLGIVALTFIIGLIAAVIFPILLLCDGWPGGWVGPVLGVILGAGGGGVYGYISESLVSIDW